MHTDTDCSLGLRPVGELREEGEDSRVERPRLHNGQCDVQGEMRPRICEDVSGLRDAILPGRVTTGDREALGEVREGRQSSLLARSSITMARKILNRWSDGVPLM
jgi:hypothetical protein